MVVVAVVVVVVSVVVVRGSLQTTKQKKVGELITSYKKSILLYRLPTRASRVR
jgi:hypothetical protein